MRASKVSSILFCLCFAASAWAQKASDGSTSLSGPHVHGNLAVYFIVAPAAAAKGEYQTLQRAMEKRSVLVHETGQVNELSVENTSSTPVYIQAGEIVKGGKQDRVIAVDLVLPPKSGKVPIASFCVEHGRWTQRGNEEQHVFGSSKGMVATRDLKMAVLVSKDQSKVWEKVSVAQKKLAGKLDTVVVGGQSASSLQLTLENAKVRRVADEYTAALESRAASVKGAVGVVFIVNGEVSGADSYASTSLFTSMWPKLLHAAAVEATAESSDEGKIPVPTSQAVLAWMFAADQGNEVKLTNPSGSKLKQKESKTGVLIESRAGENDEWLHRNYIRK